MDVAAYAVEAEAEQTHWWFVGRRRLFAREIAKLGLDRSASVLDVGSSTGTNLRLLRDEGYQLINGLDFSDESIRWCAQKALPPVRKGDVCALPFGDNSFDLVLATDIIEHVDDDQQAIREIQRVLKPGGHVLITVPTFAALWGLQDVKAHHKRRYRMARLLDVVRGGNMETVRSYYFNFILFVPIWLARRIIDLIRVDLDSEVQVNSSSINRLLSWIFTVDLALAPVLRVPFGVSALVVAKRPTHVA